MEIKIRDYAQGDTAISYEEGKKCYQKIKKYITQEKIVLDFENVKYVITAFLNPIVGDLIINYGDEVMKKIEITNASEDILKKVKIVKDGALLKRDDSEDE